MTMDDAQTTTINTCQECQLVIPDGMIYCQTCWWILFEASEAELNQLIYENNCDFYEDV
jgi:hypothetical protein